MVVIDNPELSKSTLPQSSPRAVTDNEDVMACLEEERCQVTSDVTTNMTLLPSHTFCSLETASHRPKPKQPAAEPVWGQPRGCPSPSLGPSTNLHTPGGCWDQRGSLISKSTLPTCNRAGTRGLRVGRRLRLCLHSLA